jgi:uncharacterized protein (DUF983 family)
LNVAITDYSRDEIQRLANDAIREYGGPEKVSVHFKFTCDHCGERCMFEEPNVLFERGTCHVCGKETVVTKAGFLLSWESPVVGNVVTKIHD